MIDKGYIIRDDGRYDWTCEHENRPSAWGIDGGKVISATIVKDGRVCGIMKRDYSGMPKAQFAQTLLYALIERFGEDE